MNIVSAGVDAYFRFWARLVLKMRRPCIVGVTGSVGKTTTKEVIAVTLSHPAARSRVGHVRKSPGNLNSRRAFPLVILGYDDRPGSRLQVMERLVTVPFRALRLATVTRFPKLLVLEYAMGWGGDIAAHVAIAPPTVAVVTAIGPAHLETFKTVERIIEEKSSLVRAVPPSGLVVLGQDNPHSAGMARFSGAPVVHVAGRGRTLSENAARVVGGFFGVPAAAIEDALRDVRPIEGRLATHHLESLTLIDDAYNANPLSMEFGLGMLPELAAPGQRRVAILADMLELGADAARYHRQIAPHARRAADVLVGVGKLAAEYQPDLWFNTADDCAAHLSDFVRRGDCVYLKGSHSMHLDLTVARLKDFARGLNACRAGMVQA
jgi:UDP-N-acetylmuramoyl-tripeptide--D-alanyl-D-alanine ligase